MSASQPPSPRWLLLIHQLPPAPAYLRVKTARQLQKVGAVAVKNSVYVLPNSEAAHESFTWIAREIAAEHGESSICESSFVGGTSIAAVEALFNAARDRDYQALASEAREVLKGLGKGRRVEKGKRSPANTALARLRRRHAEMVEIDFFGAPVGEAVLSTLDALAERLREPEAKPAAPAPTTDQPVRRGTWVTRQGVHVDRIASAWLIPRVIGQAAPVQFVPPKGYPPE